MTYTFHELKSSLSLEEIEIDQAIDKLCVYSMHNLSWNSPGLIWKFFFRILIASMCVQILLIRDDYKMVIICQFILNVVRVALYFDSEVYSVIITCFILTVHLGDFEKNTLPLDPCLLSTLIF